MAQSLQYYSITLRFGGCANSDFTKWDNTPTEKGHLKFCKLYLGVNRKASNLACRGELGKFPLIIPILKKLFNYMKHISEIPDHDIVKQTFFMSKRLTLTISKESLYCNIISLFKISKFYPNITDIEHFVNNTSINDFVKIIKEKYTLFRKEKIQNSSKLSFYSSFKKSYELEQYLTIIKDANQKDCFQNSA